MSQQTKPSSANTSPTVGVAVDGTREFGPKTGVPVVLLHHFTAVIDDWDPRVIDGIASERRVITFDNRGVGGTKGRTPKSVSAMADDAIAFIRALGLEQVDLLGFSLGGFILNASRPFANAAAVCETAGFDGVQVHAAHGYLVTQFLSPLTNLRTDEWGGDPQRRMRFLIEVVRRIRARVSPGFAVSVKLNSADFQLGGFTEDESRDVVAALAREGLDLIEISGGNYESPAMSGSAADSTRAREAYFLDYARTVRDLAGNVPLAVTGGFRSRAGMDEALHAGDCDVVGIARPTATTPGAAATILTGEAETLTTHELRYGMRRALGMVVDLKALDGVLNIGWHTDQLHRLGAGRQPDLDRGRLATTVALLRRNGRASFRPKRGARS